MDPTRSKQGTGGTDLEVNRLQIRSQEGSGCGHAVGPLDLALRRGARSVQHCVESVGHDEALASGAAELLCVHDDLNVAITTAKLTLTRVNFVSQVILRPGVAAICHSDHLFMSWRARLLRL